VCTGFPQPAIKNMMVQYGWSQIPVISQQHCNQTKTIRQIKQYFLVTIKDVSTQRALLILQIVI